MAYSSWLFNISEWQIVSAEMRGKKINVGISDQFPTGICEIIKSIILEEPNTWELCEVKLKIEVEGVGTLARGVIIYMPMSLWPDTRLESLRYCWFAVTVSESHWHIWVKDPYSIVTAVNTHRPAPHCIVLIVFKVPGVRGRGAFAAPQAASWGDCVSDLFFVCLLYAILSSAAVHMIFWISFKLGGSECDRTKYYPPGDSDWEL